MNCEKELAFLCNTLKKLGIPVSFTDADELFSSVVPSGLKLLIGKNDSLELSFSDLIGGISDRTVYKLKTDFALAYTFILFSHKAKDQLFVIGPYLTSQLDDKRILELCERFSIPSVKHRLVRGCYEGLATADDGSSVNVMTDQLAETIWGERGYTFVDLTKSIASSRTALLQNHSSEDVDGILLNMEIMERRYAYENELIRAISQGQINKISRLTDVTASISFEKRVADPLRNLKNYCIIMNTLCRKAAEQGGVHPLYLNDISSDYAAKIELLTKVSSASDLMLDMFRSYCKLVRSHSMRNYSATVQKVIAIIDSDLSANLSLGVLARSQNINPAYLSTVFKKETGKTVVEYINSERIRLAKHLLETTHLQIQTIAVNCGIMDVQYFSKVFKKYTEKTPKEYRKSLK